LRFDRGGRLGPYEILAPLGAGGMGEVYRAKDPRLGREVAIKVLPAEVAADGERLRRFEQEARAASALNHPNILTLHDLGSEEGCPYLVLELLDGRSLREVIAEQGPVPLRRALDWGAQIARGLAAAHAKGIVHRDLKPENLFLCRDGRIKILDFGLAKLVLPEEPGSRLARATTIAEPTHTGVVLGTAGYMAPEQVRGERVDARADLFALGCVLYELLTGVRAFGRQSAAESMSAILRDEPRPVASVVPDRAPPAAVEALVRRCLEKDPDDRFGSARDVAFALEALTAEGSGASLPGTALSSGAGGEPVPASTPRLLRRIGVWAAIASLGAAAGIVALLATRSVAPPAKPADEIRFSLRVPHDQLFLPEFALAPDGSALVVDIAEGYSEDRATYTSSHFFLRRLDDETLHPLAGTEWSWAPFFSPDGASVAFYTSRRQRLERISIAGGQPQKIVDLTQNYMGADWAPDGSIFVSAPGIGLSRVPATGGSLSPVTFLERDFEAGEIYQTMPQVLPGSRSLLFAASSDTEAGGARLAAFDLVAEKRRNLVEDARFGRYADGLLVYSRDGGDLYAVPFDPEALELRGEPKPTGVSVETSYRVGRFALSSTGTLAYLPRGKKQPARLLLIDTEGGQTALPSDYQNYLLLARISPDGRRLVSAVQEPDWRIVTFDLDGGGRRIVDECGCYWPIWTADGASVIYNRVSEDTSAVNLYRKAADGSGSAERLTNSSEHQQALSVTPDGRWLMYSQQSPTSGFDLRLLALDGEDAARVLLQTAANEFQGVFSPDGNWFAYTSDESGRLEVYLRAFPSGEGMFRVSQDGGNEPVWSRDGRTIYFRDISGHIIWSASFDAASSPIVGTPRHFATGSFTDVLPFGRQIDTTPDGRVLVASPPLTIQREFRVVVNWAAAVKRRLGFDR